jgi:hypothetical protein
MVDLANVARYFINGMIKRYILQAKLLEQELAGLAGNNGIGPSSGGGSFGFASGFEGPSSSATAMGANVYSFATNNQERNVDEADIIKSDGSTGTTYGTSMHKSGNSFTPYQNHEILTLYYVFFSICCAFRLHCHVAGADRCISGEDELGLIGRRVVTITRFQ